MSFIFFFIFIFFFFIVVSALDALTGIAADTVPKEIAAKAIIQSAFFMMINLVLVFY